MHKFLLIYWKQFLYISISPKDVSSNLTCDIALQDKASRFLESEKVS